MALHPDDQFTIIEALLPDELYFGQEKIGFYVPEDFDPESGSDFPAIPIEIQEEEERKLNELVFSLADTLFKEKEFIIFNLTKYKIQMNISNREFLGRFENESN